MRAGLSVWCADAGCAWAQGIPLKGQLCIRTEFGKKGK